MKVGTITTCVLAVLALASVPAAAQEAEPTEVNSSVEVTARPDLLKGRVVAPFEEAGAEGPCESGREVVVSIKTRSGFKRLSVVETGTDGTWSAAAPREDRIYKVRVKAADFTYSPSYGELQEGRCLATSLVGKKVTARRFKVLTKVLGTRITRSASGAPLPRTGRDATPVALLGLGLITVGGAALRATHRLS